VRQGVRGRQAPVIAELQAAGPGGLKRETGMKRSAYQLRPKRTNSHRPLTTRVGEECCVWST